MIEPEERTVDEVESMVDDLEIEFGDTVKEAVFEAGREYITKMRDAGNVVMSNPYGQPIIELIVPRDVAEEVNDLVDEWDMNPSGYGIMPQEPSFSDDRPEISEGLCAWQFLLDDDEGKEMASCGYDIETIVEELDSRGVDYLFSKAPSVRGDLPCE